MKIVNGSSVGIFFFNKAGTSGIVSNLFGKQAWLQPCKEFKCTRNLIGLLWDYLHMEAKPKPRNSAEGDPQDSSSISG